MWTKLTVACDTATHFLAARVSTGPSNDSPQFPPIMAQASLVVTWDRVLADAAFDSEAHHAYTRENLGIRSSVIPINPRGHAGEPGGTYRQQMARRFAPRPEGSRSKRVFGQRWQVESAFSRHKRRLGSALGAGRTPRVSGSANSNADPQPRAPRGSWVDGFNRATPSGSRTPRRL